MVLFGSVGICVVYECVSANLYMCSCVCNCMYGPVRMEARGQYCISSSNTLHLTLWDRLSYWTWRLPIWLNRLPSDLQGSSCLHFPAWGCRHTPLYTVFTWVLGIWNQSSCLHGCHLTNWTLFLAPNIKLLKASTLGPCIVLVRLFIAVTKWLGRSTKGRKFERF